MKHLHLVIHSYSKLFCSVSDQTMEVIESIGTNKLTENNEKTFKESSETKKKDSMSIDLNEFANFLPDTETVKALLKVLPLPAGKALSTMYCSL